ncbi:HdeA/HdeB family chaperone [Bradyrhizobium sp. USDA 4353]
MQVILASAQQLTGIAMNKATFATVVLMCSALAAAAHAKEDDKKKGQPALGQWTCQNFLEVQDVLQPRVIYFASGYAAKRKADDAIIDIDGTEKIVPIVISECSKAPKSRFWSIVKSAWRKVEADLRALEEKI